jgi:uncharacterized coiled-coil DUF342 family protein
MMFWSDFKFPSPFYLVVFMEQLTTLDIEPGDKDSATRYFSSLKEELADEKAQEQAQAKVQTLICAVEDLKKMADKFVAQVPELEEKGQGRA